MRLPEASVRTRKPFSALSAPTGTPNMAWWYRRRGLAEIKSAVGMHLVGVSKKELVVLRRIESMPDDVPSRAQLSSWQALSDGQMELDEEVVVVLVTESEKG